MRFICIGAHPDDCESGFGGTAPRLADAGCPVRFLSVTCPDAPGLRRNPIFLYLEDSFRSPVAFAPDLVVDIDAVWEGKLAALDAHASQFYEWLPWISGQEAPQSRALRERYPQREIAHAEAFQVCEYGPAPSPEELDVIFPR